ncbi:MAG: DMT family transporter [Cyanobacteriota bacterium]|nr:DMT family transporter [Cyanobacteriota bacterium]
MSRSQQAYAYALLAVCGWATAASAFKLALQTLDPLQLLAAASLASLGVLMGVVIAEGKWALLGQQSFREVALSALQGSLNPSAYYLVLLQAYDRLPAQAALALNYTWPLMLALLAVPILGERLRARTLGAIGLSLVGVILIATGGALASLEVRDPVGVGLALASSGIWALYWLVNVRDPRDGVIKLWMGFAWGSLFSGLLWLGWGEVRWLTLPEVGLSFYVGTAEMGLTFVCWLRALDLATQRAAIANWVYLAPFLSLALISWILQEPILPGSIVGLGLIIVGILWQARIASSSP